MLKIVCVTGMRGCGKTVFGQLVRSKGYPVYEMSSIVVEMMNNENVIINNNTMREYAKGIREKFGKSVVAERMVEKIQKEKVSSDVLVIVGIRGMYEIRMFRETFGENNVILLAIHSPPRVRFERVINRERKIDDPKTYDEFLWSEEIELGYGISKAIALADKMIVNDGSIDGFIAKCEEFIKTVVADEGVK